MRLQKEGCISLGRFHWVVSVLNHVSLVIPFRWWSFCDLYPIGFLLGGVVILLYLCVSPIACFLQFKIFFPGSIGSKRDFFPASCICIHTMGSLLKIKIIRGVWMCYLNNNFCCLNNTINIFTIYFSPTYIFTILKQYY